MKFLILKFFTKVKFTNYQVTRECFNKIEKYDSFIHVTPFLNKTRVLNSHCSFRSGFNKAINEASKFFLVLLFLDACDITVQVKECSMF